jgi:hypothetical protein
MTKFTAGQTVVATKDFTSNFHGRIITKDKRYVVTSTGIHSGRPQVRDDRGVKRFFDTSNFIDANAYEIEKAKEQLNRFEPGEIIPWHVGNGIVRHILIAPKMKPKTPRSIKIDPKDAKAALSKMLKEVYGIDATVEQVIGAMDKSLELVLGA